MKKLSKFIVSIIGEFPYLIYLDKRAKYFPSTSQSIANVIYQDQEIRRITFYSSFIRWDDLCFDIGANIGNRISPLLAIGALVVAVEPQKAYGKFLKYKFGNKINVVPNGAGCKIGKETLYIADASTISSFSTEWIESVKTDRFECNYTIGESMVFESQNWYSVDELKGHILTSEFLRTEFGDVYIRKSN
jgi:hypothetical protein